MLFRIFGFAVITAVLIGLYGCATTQPETFMKRATAQTREVLEFDPCPYGVAEADLSAHAEVDTTYTSDPKLRAYRDYSKSPWGQDQYYRAPREVVNKSAGGRSAIKCKPAPGVKPITKGK